MRRIAVTLAFAVLSLGFAPAPFPKAERATQRKSEAALVRQCLRRLDELGVELHVEDRGGRHAIRYRVSRPGAGTGYGGSFGDANLLRALRRVVEIAERFRDVDDTLRSR
jgi:hypothetical protein